MSTGRHEDEPMADGRERGAHGRRPPRPRCGAHARSTGGPCRRGAGAGTSHPGVGRCSHHGGASPNGVRHAERLASEQAARQMGLGVEDGPASALLAREVARSAALVSAYASIVAGLDAEQLTWGVTQRRIRPGRDGEPPQVEVLQQARIHPLLVLLDRERATLRQTIETTHRCGIEERMASLAEMFGTQLARVIDSILGDLELTPEQLARVPNVVPLRLRELAAAGDDTRPEPDDPAT